jgi:hypothetical protein
MEERGAEKKMHFKFELSDLKLKERQRREFENFCGDFGASFRWTYIGGQSKPRPYECKIFWRGNWLIRGRADWSLARFCTKRPG